MRISARNTVLRVLLAVLLLVTSATVALADVATISYGAARTGWDSAEPGLTPANTVSSDFGQQFATQLDGQIYAQPLVVGGRVIVATEHDKVYAVDPAGGGVLWSRDLGPSWPASAIGCSDLAPDLGVTSTPVYDPATGAVYLTTKVNDGADVQHPHWYMHALDPATGAERSGWPVTIAGTPANDPTVPFDAMHEMQRPGLLLMNGVVYAGFGSHCDFGPYRGYVVGVSTSQARVSAMYATSSGASNNGAGVWHAGGGLVSDGAGRIVLSTGNGVYPPAGPGTSPPTTLSESVVRLQVNADGSLTPADFFSPANAPTLDANDTDLGSGGPVALPDSFGTAAHPHVLFQQGKDGRVFLLDRDSLGGRAQGTGGTDNVLGVVGPYQGLWGHPAVWGGDGGYVYMVDNGGPLRALKSGASGSLPALTLAGTSSDSFPYTSGSPLVTSDGTTSGSAVVWVVWSSGPGGDNAQLRAYSALPDTTGRLTLLYSAPIGTAAKFSVPAADGNRVFVGTRDGRLLAFGRPAATALTGSPVNFGVVPVGSTTGRLLSLTATRALTVTGVTTSAPFAVTPPALPVALAAGDTLNLPVSFTPGTGGGASAIVSVVTDAGTVGFSLSGTGTQPGLSATPASAAFGQLVTGTTATVNVQVTNTGTAAETVSAAAGPAAPFSVTGLPAAGSSIAAGASIVLPVTYAPTAAATDSGSITVTSTSGTLTVPVTGTAVSGSGHLTITPAATDFGQVDTGSSRTLSFDVTNTGTVPVTITKAKAPTGDFTSSAPLPEGTVIGPEQVIHQPVTFTPSAPGVQTANYELTGDAGQGAMLVPLTGTGTGTLPAPGTAWSVNGSAALSGTDLQLTPVATQQAGSAFYRLPVPTEGLDATFTVQLGPGTGGDGLTLALLDPAKNAVTAVGGKGSGIGFSGLTGISADLVPFWNSQTGTGNFYAVAPGPGQSNGDLTWSGWAKAATQLTAGTHTVEVKVTGGHVKVTLDGGTPLDVAASVPANAYVGFTAATGSSTGSHIVRSVTIKTAAATAAGQPLTAAPAGVDLGSVPAGTTATATVTLTNGGGRTETVSAVDSPDAPWTAALPAPGTAIAPGASVSVPVTFAPAAAGAFPDTFTVTTTSGNVTVPLNGGGTTTMPAIGDSTWHANGFTTVAGTTATLTTDGQKFGAGSIVNSRQTTAIGLHASFTAQIGGSGTTGADGLTFALLDPSAGTTALGGQGGGLGVVGLPAVFLDLDTYPNHGLDYYNFAAVGTSAAGATGPVWLAGNHAIPALRTGTHTVDVTVTAASHLVVKLDGGQILDTAVTLPNKVLVAFTAGVGGLTDTHAVLNPVITYTS